LEYSRVRSDRHEVGYAGHDRRKSHLCNRQV
jgi:hypothetical protein